MHMLALKSFVILLCHRAELYDVKKAMVIGKVFPESQDPKPRSRNAIMPP